MVIGCGIFFTVKHFVNNGDDLPKEKEVNINKLTTYSLKSLSFKLPYEYYKSEYSTDELLMLALDGSKNYDMYPCDFVVSTYQVYSSLEDRVEHEISMELLSTYFQPYTILSKNINNNEWSYSIANSNPKEDGSYYTKGVYVIEYNDIRYVFTYSYSPENNKCKLLVDKVVDSLTLK